MTTTKKPSRRMAIRGFTAEQARERERQDRALEHAKTNILLDAAEELQKIEAQREKGRRELEEAKAAKAAADLRMRAAIDEFAAHCASGGVVH